MPYGLKIKKYNLQDHYLKLVCPEFVVIYSISLRVWDRPEIIYGLKVYF